MSTTPEPLNAPDPSEALPPAGETTGKTDRAKAKAHDLADQAKGRAQDAGHRASDAASQAKQKANEALGKAQGKLADSGALEKVRENPFPALGIAFGLGFLLAGSGDDEHDQHSTLSKAKNQLKGAILGGLSAAVAQEARSLVGGGSGRGGMFSSLFGGGGESSSEREQRRSGGQESAGRSPIITDTSDRAMGGRTAGT